MSDQELPGPSGKKANPFLRPCDLCGARDEKVHPMMSGGEMLVVCGMCKGDVIGGE